MTTSVRMHPYSRYALVAVALCDVGVGMILIGTLGLGEAASAVRDVVGWIMIAHAIPAAVQAIVGRLNRFGEEGLLINIGLLAFAAYQIVATGNAPRTVATLGEAVLIVSAAAATTLLWAQLSGYRLRRNPEKLRQRPRRRRRNQPGLVAVADPADHTSTTITKD